MFVFDGSLEEATNEVVRRPLGVVQDANSVPTPGTFSSGSRVESSVAPDDPARIRLCPPVTCAAVFCTSGA